MPARKGLIEQSAMLIEHVQSTTKTVGSYFSNIVEVSKKRLSELLKCEIFTPLISFTFAMCFNFHFSHSIAIVGSYYHSLPCSTAI